MTMVMGVVMMLVTVMVLIMVVVFVMLMAMTVMTVKMPAITEWHFCCCSREKAPERWPRGLRSLLPSTRILCVPESSCCPSDYYGKRIRAGPQRNPLRLVLRSEGTRVGDEERWAGAHDEEQRALERGGCCAVCTARCAAEPLLWQGVSTGIPH